MVIEQAEIHHIFCNHKYDKESDRLCFLSKNLYNATLCAVRQHYFKTSGYLNYNQVNKEFTHQNQADYRALPAKVSKWVQKLVGQDFKSFFALLKKKQQGKYENPVKIPKYAKKQERKVQQEKALIERMKAKDMKVFNSGIKTA